MILRSVKWNIKKSLLSTLSGARGRISNSSKNRVEADPGAELFEVTQLVNSLLGIIVLPREYYIKSIPEIPPTLLLFDVIENNLHVS